MKPAASAHSMADVIPFLVYSNYIPFESNASITAFQKLTPSLLINFLPQKSRLRFLLCLRVKYYSGNPLIWTPRGQAKLSVLTGCPC